jgi:ribosomal protein L16 Arg81 hydroxylase
MGFVAQTGTQQTGIRQMTQINELQHRITAALDRVAQGVARLEERAAHPVAPEPAEPGIDPAEVARLQDALDEEKLANAQLEERVRKLHETHRQELEAAKAVAVPAPAPAPQPTVDVAALDLDLQRLRQSNEMLRATNEELRRALADNVGEPHLINKAMLAELEGLRAARSVDAAETRAIIASLTPLLEAAAESEEAN